MRKKTHLEWGRSKLEILDTCFFNGVLREFGSELGVSKEIWQRRRVVFIEGKQGLGLKEGKNRF